MSPVAWASKKIQKVVTSTLSAETMAMNSTLDQMSWLKLYWSWLLNDKVPWRDPSKAFEQLPEAIATATLKDDLPSVAATDCRSLYDLLTRTAPPSCSEFRMHAGIRIRWAHTGAQVADALTKVMPSQFLRATLALGQYQLADEQELLKARATNRDRLKWLHASKQEMTSSSTENSKTIFRECESSLATGDAAAHVPAIASRGSGKPRWQDPWFGGLAEDLLVWQGRLQGSHQQQPRGCRTEVVHG